MEFLKKEAPLITASKKLLFRHVQWQYARPIEALDRKMGRYKGKVVALGFSQQAKRFWL
jgi:hypothetical protein